jgi:hypothetical protein
MVVLLIQPDSNPTVSSIPGVQSALNFFVNEFGIVRFVLKYMTSATLLIFTTCLHVMTDLHSVNET